ncbi:HAD family hydrolase [Picrophilus oshimae]|uniref:Phosphoglycolate phosphatase n=1 Tax=Picrophilus torridus (strain ATCC 700027 / DSM 9790 / JCM 10055 / NBRC 100828 / KAW 2/3) TaxID=1122961 RepID=Q6L009_PICTO|nr:HAD family phosphatase [Picrophilus oshimae]AAT43693.1 phosphoglycolate phosphatase [Picrophilus oshimae DSM 9789]
MFKAVIFDLDGTILDSIPLRVRSWQQAFDDYNISADPEIIRLMIGYPGSMLIKKVNAMNPEIEFREEYYFKMHLDELRFFPDVDDTFKELRKLGVKIAVVTSSRKDFVMRLNIKADAIVTIDDVKNGKPDTEPYIKAMSMMNVKPDETVVVGDIDNDLIPSRELGCLSVLVRHNRNVSSDHADIIIEEIKEVLNIFNDKKDL